MDTSTTSTDEKTVIDVSARGGEAFVKNAFYKIFDGQRQELHHLYRESSILLWNGNPQKGVTNIINFLKTLPSTQHSIDSIDCHPVPISGLHPTATIFINVMGTVVYGSSPPRLFNQTFLLSMDTSSTNARHYYVANDEFRLVS